MKLPQINEEVNLNYVHIRDCNFTDNTAETGAAIHMETFTTGSGLGRVPYLKIENTFVCRTTD